MAKKPEKIKAKKKEAAPSFFRTHLFELIIVSFCFLLYSNSLFNGYNMDDELVTRNHRLTSKGISAIPEIFTSPYYQDEMGYAYEYRPVVLASFAIEHSLFGDKPFVSHLINLLFYALLCVMLYKVLLRISNLFTPLFSFAVTLLFAAHTSHTEVVSSIKNRDEILGFIFCLTTLWITLKAVKYPKPLLLVLVPFVFALTLMCKITFLSFALIIIVALLLFTNISNWTLLLVSALLTVPAFLLIPIDNLYVKVLITLAIPFGSLVLYVSNKIETFNFTALATQFKRETRNIKTRYRMWFEVPNFSFSNFKQLVTGIAIPKTYFSYQAIAVPIIFLILFVIGILYHSRISTSIVLLLLLAVGTLAETKTGWWATLALYLVLGLYTSENFSPDRFTTLYVNLICLLGMYGVFLGERKLFIPSLLLIFSFAINHLYKIFSNQLIASIEALSSATELSFNLIIYFTVPLAVLFKRLRPLLFISIAIIIASIFADLYTGQMQFNIPAYVLAAVLILFVSRNKNNRYFIAGIKVVLIALVVFLQGDIRNSDRPIPGNIEIRKSLEVAGKENNISLIPKKQDRPISYVEQPISQNDSWQIRIGTAMRILFHYFSKTIVPYPLAFYYGYKFIGPEKITEIIPLISVVIHTLLVVLLLYFFKRKKVIALGIMIYLFSIAAFSNYFLSVPGVVGDRYLLVPSLGWCIILTAGLFEIWRLSTQTQNFQWSLLPKGFKYTLTAALLFYGGMTFSRNFDWKDDLTLFRKDIKYVRNSSQAHNLLAVHLMKRSFEIPDRIAQKNLQIEALGHFKSAIEIYPPFYNVAFDLGRTYAVLNIPDSAIVYFKRAISIDSTNSDPHLFVAKLLVESKRNIEAIPYFEYRIKHVSTDYSSYEALSYIFFTLKEYEKSIMVNNTAVKQFPTLIDPLVNIARTYIEQNKNDSATMYLQKAIQLNPDNPTVLQLLQQVNRK